MYRAADQTAGDDNMSEAEVNTDHPPLKKPRTYPIADIRSARDAAAAWWNVPYDEQLRRKEIDMQVECVDKMLRSIHSAYKGHGSHGKKLPTVDVSPVTMEPIVPSPQQLGYRNKCEFTFGKSSSGEEVLGFRVGHFHSGAIVAEPFDCPNVPNAMKYIVYHVTRFIRSSPLRVYDSVGTTGSVCYCSFFTTFTW